MKIAEIDMREYEIQSALYNRSGLGILNPVNKIVNRVYIKEKRGMWHVEKYVYKSSLKWKLQVRGNKIYIKEKWHSRNAFSNVFLVLMLIWILVMTLYISISYACQTISPQEFEGMLISVGVLLAITFFACILHIFVGPSADETMKAILEVLFGDKLIQIRTATQAEKREWKEKKEIWR